MSDYVSVYDPSPSTTEPAVQLAVRLSRQRTEARVIFQPTKGGCCLAPRVADVRTRPDVNGGRAGQAAALDWEEAGAVRVSVSVEEVDVEGDFGRQVPGLSVCCGRCQHTVEVFGTGQASFKRACATLRQECPQGENNFYTGDYDEGS